MSDPLLRVLLLTVWLGGTIWSSSRKGYNPLFFGLTCSLATGLAVMPLFLMR